MILHPSITEDRLEDAVRRTMFDLEMLGFCIACGEEAMGVEPDAEEYKCEACGQRKVYGAEQIMFHTVA